MEYSSIYHSPIGDIFISSDGEYITGLWFKTQKDFDVSDAKNEETQVLNDVKLWLDQYFSGKEPDFKLPIKFSGTDFQEKVWEILCGIPYGKTMTYGEISKTLIKKYHLKNMSAQAVGGAVGRNKISIIVPCHRVMGCNNKLVGYTGGMEIKKYLLKLEGHLIETLK